MRRIGVISRHVLAHDLGGVAGDIETGVKAVLQAHAGHRFGVDPVPMAVSGVDRAIGCV